MHRLNEMTRTYYRYTNRYSHTETSNGTDVLPNLVKLLKPQRSGTTKQACRPWQLEYIYTVLYFIIYLGQFRVPFKDSGSERVEFLTCTVILPTLAT